MRIINSWKTKNKQRGKIVVKVRLGRLTLLDFYYDHARSQAGVMFFNWGVKTSNRRNYEKSNHEDNRAL
jgi:hypothetical protein